MTDDAFATRIEVHHPYLMRVAMLQLRDNGLAEDVIQETIVREICKELSITSTNLWVVLTRPGSRVANAWKSTGSPSRGEPHDQRLSAVHWAY